MQNKHVYTLHVYNVLECDIVGLIFNPCVYRKVPRVMSNVNTLIICTAAVGCTDCKCFQSFLCAEQFLTGSIIQPAAHLQRTNILTPKSLLDSADAAIKSLFSDLKGVITKLQSMLTKLPAKDETCWIQGDPDKDLTWLMDTLKTISKQILTGSELCTSICIVFFTVLFFEWTLLTPHLKPCLTECLLLTLAGGVQVVARRSKRTCQRTWKLLRKAFQVTSTRTGFLCI